MASLATVSSTDALFDALQPLYTTFCRKNNQDKLLECFYGLIPRSRDLPNCDNYKVANLVFIHIPEHLVGFTALAQEVRNPAVKPGLQHNLIQLNGSSFVCRGNVISKLFQLNKKNKQRNRSNERLQALLHAMKSC